MERSIDRGRIDSINKFIVKCHLTEAKNNDKNLD